MKTSSFCVTGLPAGNRQHGIHTHTVAEIYVALRGSLRSIGPGKKPLSRHLDCIVITPHGVEVVGSEDALYFWLHDRIE